MKKNLIRGVCIFIMMCLHFSCDTGTPVPIANVNFSVSIYSNNLVHVGGYEYFTGAIAGLVVYRVNMTDFCAYDRACPYDWKEGGYVSVNDSNSFQLICGSCHSTFNILNGYPIGKVKANAPLRAYRAIMVDDINLRISK